MHSRPVGSVLRPSRVLPAGAGQAPGAHPKLRATPARHRRVWQPSRILLWLQRRRPALPGRLGCATILPVLWRARGSLCVGPLPEQGHLRRAPPIPDRLLPREVEAYLPPPGTVLRILRSEEHTSELQSRQYLVCRLLLEKKNTKSPKLSTVSTHNTNL